MIAAAQTTPHIAFVPSLSSYHPFSATPMYQSEMLAWADVPGLSLATPSPTAHGFSSHLQPLTGMRDNTMSPPISSAPGIPQTFPSLGLPMRPASLERRESSFRPSKYEFEVTPAPSRPFQTSAFEQ